MTRKVYQELASLVDAYHRCMLEGNSDWADRHQERITEITDRLLPHGSGFDDGCHVDVDRSNGNQLVIQTSFHHMNEHGYYVGWEDYRVTVRADLIFGFTLKITGRDRNGFKEYARKFAYSEFTEALNADMPKGF